ncbi:hypothetical protein [Sphingopyxis macrogoltabida]|uniref:DUF3892 domain-containing protein n=1 Tax=Sphingopyxis macrogoltabida TaxID=33050 RepID=A0A0N7GSK4_SPHMC|nr:hypothetical protein [Sphingopyxis macrogoltabida]ALH80963.1 hypothetical protein AN936_11465 [Sphingopyxis macrogoltabida]
MADHEIIAVREAASNGRTHHIAAVKVGESLFLADQIVDWITAGTHRFWVWFQNEKVDVVAREQGSSRRYYLTIAGGSFPPVALLSLPRF